MSVYSPIRKRENDNMIVPEGTGCFMCGEAVWNNDAAIVWMPMSDCSADTHWWHPDCALHFVIALSRDLSELKNQDNLRPRMVAEKGNKQ